MHHGKAQPLKVLKQALLDTAQFRLLFSFKSSLRAPYLWLEGPFRIAVPSEKDQVLAVVGLEL
jgi:hypothetical protein